ncbi:MAG: polyprenol monophosphomannose synthase [Ferroplasma sp.]
MADTVSIIVPALNERENLENLISRLKNQSLNSIYIIDDNSNDGTPELEAEFPDVHFLYRSSRLGLISAEIDGMRLTDSNYVVIMDADLSHSPEDIRGMLAQAIETGSDLVVGSRYTGSGENNDELVRKVISRTANMLFKISFGITVKDCTSGFRVYSRKACNYLGRQVDLENGYVGQVDIVNRLTHNNFKITEYPVKFIKRTEGKSKLKMREIVNFFLFIIYNKKIFRPILGASMIIIFFVAISFILVLLI